MAGVLKNEGAAVYGIRTAADLGRLWLEIFGAEADAERLREMADLDAYHRDTGAFAGLPDWEKREAAESYDAWRRTCGGADVELAKRIPLNKLAQYVDCEALGEYILDLGGWVTLIDDGIALFRLYAFRHRQEWIDKIRMAAEQSARRKGSAK